jgi:DNA-binding NarL/FixJ family response regulator
VIILTVHREAVYLSLAFNAGARGYILKRSAVAELPQAVLRVLAGDRYIGQGVGGRGVGATRETGHTSDRHLTIKTMRACVRHIAPTVRIIAVLARHN